MVSDYSTTSPKLSLLSQKTCSKCRTSKPYKDFSVHSRTKDGYQAWCKLCTQAYHDTHKERLRAQARERQKANPDAHKRAHARYAERHRERLRQRAAEYRRLHPDKIKRAQQKYEEIHKERITQRSAAYRTANRDKVRLAVAIHYSKPENRNKKRQYKKEYDREHKERISMREALYRETHRDEIRERQRKRYQQDRLHHSMSVLVRHSLRKSPTGVQAKGRRTWESLVGYSLNELRGHLEKQFTDGMSWELFCQGVIHIDHIIPRSRFHFVCPEDEDFKKCWALENLQPLWKHDNLSKGNRYEGKPCQDTTC